MRKVVDMMWQTKNLNKEGEKYDLYCYQLDDGSEVQSIRKYNKGEYVRHWFDDQYNRQKIGKLCQKCMKPMTSEVEHEFCNYSRS